MRSIRGHTVTLLLVAWMAATSLEASLVSAQENVWFGYAFVTAGVKYGTLALLGAPIWRACQGLSRASYSTSTSRLAAAHVALGLAVFIVWQAAYYGFLYLLIGSLRPLNLARTAGWQALNALFTYTLLVAIIVGQQMAGRLREQQERESQLGLLAREAEITALKAQVRPHFLFNVLNSIYALIPTQPAQAQAMVERLGDLMRHTMEVAEESLMPLSAELASIENYLHIEQIRLGDRLQVTFDIDAAPLEALVPPLVFQPLVENAVKHGIAPFRHAGWIEVRAARCAGGMELVVRDSGPGMAIPQGDGRGLSLTDRRLRLLYGQRFALDLRNLTPRGFEARLQLPFDEPQPGM